MTSRVALLLWVLLSKNCFFLLEQPMSSLMIHHPRMQEVCRHFVIYKAFVWLGAYGGGSPKPTYLWSGHKFVEQLAGRTITRDTMWRDAPQMSVYSSDSNGRKRVSGGPKLKSSQAYPLAFGRAVARTFVDHSAKLSSGELNVQQKKAKGRRPSATKVCWSDADLNPVFNFLLGLGPA
jgi:hypothetical protein